MSQPSTELPSRELEFSIDIEGDWSRKRYTGDFVFRIPNLKQKAKADILRAQLNEGMDEKIDDSVYYLHFMVAYLRYSLTKVPDWWRDAENGYSLDDFNVVEEVYTKAEKFNKEWNEKVWGNGAEEESKE